MNSEFNDASRGEMVLYQAPDGTVELNVRLERESLWLSQRQMSLLFDKDTDTIGLHLRNIFSEGELDESSTTEDSSVVQTEGTRQVRRQVRLVKADNVEHEHVDEVEEAVEGENDGDEEIDSAGEEIEE